MMTKGSWFYSWSFFLPKRWYIYSHQEVAYLKISHRQPRNTFFGPHWIHGFLVFTTWNSFLFCRKVAWKSIIAASLTLDISEFLILPLVTLTLESRDMLFPDKIENWAANDDKKHRWFSSPLMLCLEHQNVILMFFKRILRLPIVFRYAKSWCDCHTHTCMLGSKGQKERGSRLQEHIVALFNNFGKLLDLALLVR